MDMGLVYHPVSPKNLDDLMAGYHFGDKSQNPKGQAQFCKSYRQGTIVQILRRASGRLLTIPQRWDLQFRRNVAKVMEGSSKFSLLEFAIGCQRPNPADPDNLPEMGQGRHFAPQALAPEVRMT